MVSMVTQNVSWRDTASRIGRRRRGRMKCDMLNPKIPCCYTCYIAHGYDVRLCPNSG